MAMRTPFRAASRMTRSALQATRTRPPSVPASILRCRRFPAPRAAVHTTARKTQEAAALRRDDDAVHFEAVREASAPNYNLTADGNLEVHNGDRHNPQTRVFDSAYLRDRCPCPQCISPSSGNKNFSTGEIPPEIRYKDVVEQSDGSVRITWENDLPRAAAAGHVSVFPPAGDSSLARIAEESDEPYAPLRIDHSTAPFCRIAWDRKDIAGRLVKLDYADFMAGGFDFQRGAYELARTGLLFLTNVPQTETAVADIALAFGAVKETFYGRTWDVVSKSDAENVAYTATYLGLHSDMLYLESPPRIQLLHCLENSCSGGESIFSDALRASRQLRETRREDFDALAELRVPYHYSTNGFSYRQTRPVLEVDNESSPPSWEVWWSPPFQAPFSVPADVHAAANWRRWQRAAANFQGILESEDNMFRYKLQPGECVLFDNRRVLHGRDAFDVGSGSRWLKGTYVADEDFVSSLNGVMKSEGFRNYRQEAEGPAEHGQQTTA